MICDQTNFTGYYKLFKQGHPSITPDLAITIEDLEKFMKKKSLDILNEKHVEELEEIVMFNEKVENLTVISTFKNLKYLTLWDTSITNESLWPLTKLTKLEELGLDGTKINDLTAVGKLGSLLKLTLNDTEVKELSPLENLKSLASIHLSGCKRLKNIQPLGSLQDLLEIA